MIIASNKNPSSASSPSRSSRPSREHMTPTCRTRLASPRAFTLIELVIAAGLMAMILVGAYLCLHAGIAAQKMVEPRVDAAQTGRVVLNLLSSELRAACPLSKDFDFLGANHTLRGADADTLNFATHHVVPPLGPRDYCQVSYYLRPGTNSASLTLWRRRNPRMGLDPLEGGPREIIAHGVHSLNLEYYDGLDWHEDWGEEDPSARARQESSWRAQPNLSGFPEAVRITLRMDPSSSSSRASESASSTNREPPMVFQTVVRLNLARRPAPASGGANTQATSDGNNPGAPGAQPAPGPF
jgi:prepilin-type N-terminal cleavage/methylation domain-containing protein